MTIKEKTILIKLHNSTAKFYEKLKYDLPTKINKQGKVVFDYGVDIEIRVKDLPSGSHAIVTKLCDYGFEGCTKEVENQFYQAVIRQRVDGKDGCFNCVYKKYIKDQTVIKKSQVISDIIVRHNKQLVLNSKSVQKDNNALYSKACNFFGSWENAINESGLDYENIREDSLRMGYYGQKFEKLLKKIFKDIYGKSIKKGYNKYLQPDFNFGNKSWGDAKLSEWTVDGSGTIEKYEPYCDTLMIVYLRGDKNKNEKISEKTTLISAYKLIKELPQEKEDYYISLLDELWEKLRVQQEENYNNVEICGDPNNPIGYYGIHWSNNKKRWCTEIIINKKKIWIGQFTSEKECAVAYDTFVLENELSKPINFGINPFYKGVGSKYKGIHWDRRKNKWIAATSIKNKSKHIGNFDTEIRAAKAYNKYLIDNKINRKLNII